MPFPSRALRQPLGCFKFAGGIESAFISRIGISPKDGFLGADVATAGGALVSADAGRGGAGYCTGAVQAAAAGMARERDRHGLAGAFDSPHQFLRGARADGSCAGQSVGISVGWGTLGPKRYIAPPLPFSALPPIDVVLLSHAHMDHMDLRSLRQVARSTPVVTAALTRDVVEKAGARQIAELRWNEASTSKRGTAI